MQIPVHPHALGKLEKMLYRISIEGLVAYRKKAHWKGAWDQQLYEATRIKNWKRKLSVCYSDEKRWIKKRKRQIKRMRRKKRNEAINAARHRADHTAVVHYQTMFHGQNISRREPQKRQSAGGNLRPLG